MENCRGAGAREGPESLGVRWLAQPDTAQACPDRPRTTPVRIPPLGSPTATLKRSYVHVPRVPATVVTRGVTLLGGGVRAGWVPGCGIPGGWWEGAYRVPPSHHRILVLPGPTHASGLPTVSLQALQALPGPSAHLQLPHPYQGQYGEIQPQ